MQHPVFYIFYKSHIPLAGRNPDHILRAMVQKVSRLNKTVHIPTVLGYCIDEQNQNLEVVQYIEGSSQDIQQTWISIQQDTQQHDITLLFEGTHKHRLFESSKRRLVNLQDYPFLFGEPSGIANQKYLPKSLQTFQFSIGQGSYEMQNDKRHLVRSSLLSSDFVHPLQPNHSNKNFSTIKWNEKKFSAFLGQLQKSYQPSTKGDKQAWDDDQPMWVQNRKLLVRVFILWILLVIALLINVFSKA